MSRPARSASSETLPTAARPSSPRRWVLAAGAVLLAALGLGALLWALP